MLASGSASAFWSKSPASWGPSKDWSRVLPFLGAQQETLWDQLIESSLLIGHQHACRNAWKRSYPILFLLLPPQIRLVHSVKVLPAFLLPYHSQVNLNRSFALQLCLSVCSLPDPSTPTREKFLHKRISVAVHKNVFWQYCSIPCKTGSFHTISVDFHGSKEVSHHY